jgi:hypothetical protein
MNKLNYHSKILNLLNTPTYRKFYRSPINKISKSIKYALKHSSLDDNIKKFLEPKNYITLRIYGQHEIHKQEIILHPIVSTINSPTYDLTNYLAKFLQPLIVYTTSFIKDSTYFIKFLHHLKLENNDILVRFDVVSFFTKIVVCYSGETPLWTTLGFNMYVYIIVYKYPTFYNYPEYTPHS